MKFSIDWGTIVVSIPVIVASCIGAAKFFGETYFKEYFTKRTKEIEKDYDVFKSKLETEQKEYLKKMDIQIERNKFIVETYTPKYIEATEKMRNTMKDCFSFSKTADFRNWDEFEPKNSVLLKQYESNYTYITPALERLFKSFIELYKELHYAMRHYYQKDSDDKRYENYMKIKNELDSVHSKIEALIRSELSGQN